MKTKTELARIMYTMERLSPPLRGTLRHARITYVPSIRFLQRILLSLFMGRHKSPCKRSRQRKICSSIQMVFLLHNMQGNTFLRGIACITDMC